jgi:hypothetical protein
MGVITLGFFGWFIVTFLLLMICPKERIPLIREFFERILPRLPITGIIKAIKNKKKP